MGKGFVSFKGMADGVGIYLDASAPMYLILDELEHKIDSNRAFFGDGNCAVAFRGRKLTGGERQRLSDAMSYILPLCRVRFDEPKTAPASEWAEEYKEKHRHRVEDDPQDERDPVTDDKSEDNVGDAEEEFVSVFRSSRARLYRGILKDGMELSSDGHLVLLGTAEAGSYMEAAGDIIVIGGLYGTAHAGRNGHNGSKIIAFDMRPERLMIASASEDYIWEETDTEEVPPAGAEKRRGILSKIRKKEENETELEENKKNSEYAAVALCKNNKIILDNFTIHAFTNPKNMI